MQAREFYTSNIQKGKIEISRLKKVLIQFSMLRLAIFLAIIGLSYLFRSSIGAVTLIIASGITLFLLFVSKFTDAKNQREYYNRYVRINEIELRVLQGDIAGLKTGKQFIFENHYYNQDIDLFDDLSPEEEAKIPHVCSSLDEALRALDSDREFLKAGGVFDDDTIDAYIALRMEEV